MLTSFFNKSKPIQFLVVGLYMTIFYCFANFSNINVETDVFWYLKKFGGLIVFLSTMIVIQFFIRRSEFTKNRTYKIFLFATFTAMFPVLLQNTDLIFANLFVVMGLRRLVELRTSRFVKEKIFDAVFWICIASLFSFWTVAFILIVYCGILLHAAQNFRHWLIPILSFLAVTLLVNSFYLLIFDRFFTISDWYQNANFDFAAYRNFEILIPVSLLLALLLWSLPYFLNVLRTSSAIAKPSLIVILLYLITSVFIGVFSFLKNGSEVIYFLVPLAVIVATYINKLDDQWFKEVLLVLLCLLPLLLLFI
ncbi:MAG TPA: DUF6427 family protein [Salinimicrobium sp.]|nr:DUF6427 family protein [Salinimicrobium sp.]